MSGNGVGMGKLSEFEKELVLDNSKANLKMEGYNPSEKYDDLLYRMLDGEISIDDVKTKIREDYNV